MARPPQTVSNMVRSMIVVIVGVVLIVIATVAKKAPSAEIDYQATWRAAQREVTAFTPVAPRSLPQGWKVSGVNFTKEPLAWRLAFTTSSGRYAAIEQGPERATWIKSATKSGQWQGWTRWDSPSWRAMGRGDVLLCGDAPFEELEQLANRL